jgi:CRISPR-associated endonuclease/helicase Cas3
MLFRDVQLDKKRIQGDRTELDYPKVAEKYKLIEATIPVVILSYDNREGERRLQKYIKNPSRDTWRSLMPYVVNLSCRDFHREDIRECIQEVNSCPGLYQWFGGYDDKTHRGIQDIVYDPADLYVGD